MYQEVQARNLQKEKADYLEKVEARNKNHGMVTINVPDDGVFTILNTKQTLETFKKKAKSFPSTTPKPKPTVPGVIRKTPQKETIDAIFKLTGDKKYFSDGSIIIKGKPPVKIKYREKGPSQESMVEILNAKTEPADLKYYAFTNPDTGEGVSGTPIPDVLIDSVVEANRAKVIFQSKDGEAL